MVTNINEKLDFYETRLDRQESLASTMARVIALSDYEKMGWPVIPLHTPVPDGGCSCYRGKDCKTPGKHPRTSNGLKDASTDSITIMKWWKDWPDANIGIVTGAESGLIVLDVDPRNGGDDTLATWETQEGRLNPTLTVRTGGGGWHLYFKHPGGQVKSRPIGPGVDLKADGGYVVAPPSIHPSGSYTWGGRS